MAEFTRETITTQGNNADNTVINKQARREATSFQTVEYLVYFMFGVLEILLVFRLILKLAGASVSSVFVGLIYGVTGIFILPFEGIFRQATTPGLETTSVLEPATLISIVVYAVLAWAIVRLILIFSGEKQQTD